MPPRNDHDRRMREKLRRIAEDPEAYYAEARKLAYREEVKRALMPWRKPERQQALNVAYNTR